MKTLKKMGKILVVIIGIILTILIVRAILIVIL